MQKVKVQRYISGKKPDYAQGVTSSEESEAEDFIEQQRPERRHQIAQIISQKDDIQSHSENEVKSLTLRNLFEYLKMLESIMLDFSGNT